MTDEQKQLIDKLQLTSDIFFGVVLEDIKACQEVVRIITGEEITLVEVRNQETILQLKTHSIRLDIWAEDIYKNHIGIEMHPQSNENRVKRNRYNIASIDTKSLKIGVEYDDIPDTIGIYITEADFLKTKRGVNKVERSIRDSMHQVKSIPNGTSEYYVSLSCEGDTPAQTELLKYMRNSDGVISNKYFPNLVKRVRFLKEEQEGGNMMCEIMDRIRIEGEARGRKEGEAAGMVMTLKILNFQQEEIVTQLMNNLKLTKEEAQKILLDN